MPVFVIELTEEARVVQLLNRDLEPDSLQIRLNQLRLVGPKTIRSGHERDGQRICAPRILKQSLGPTRVIRVNGTKALIVSRLPRHKRTCADLIVSVEDDLANVCLVDRKLDGLPNFLLIERRFMSVEHDVLVLQEVAGNELESLVASYFADVLEI